MFTFGPAFITPASAGPAPSTDSLLLSSIDELDAPAYMLLSGDQQSGTDELKLTGTY